MFFLWDGVVSVWVGDGVRHTKAEFYYLGFVATEIRKHLEDFICSNIRYLSFKTVNKKILIRLCGFVG